MAILKKPKTQKNQILVFLSGIFAAVLGLFYLINQLDLVPDGLGFLGYIDDIIVLILIAFFINKFVKSISLKVKKNKAAYSELWRKGNLFKLLMKPRTWVTIWILTGAFVYFFWALDVIPDAIAGIGYVDDAIAAITAWITIMRLNR